MQSVAVSEAVTQFLSERDRVALALTHRQAREVLRPQCRTEAVPDDRDLERSLVASGHRTACFADPSGFTALKLPTLEPCVWVRLGGRSLLANRRRLLCQLRAMREGTDLFHCGTRHETVLPSLKTLPWAQSPARRTLREASGALVASLSDSAATAQRTTSPLHDADGFTTVLSRRRRRRPRRWQQQEATSALPVVDADGPIIAAAASLGVQRLSPVELVGWLLEYPCVYAVSTPLQDWPHLPATSSRALDGTPLHLIELTIQVHGRLGHGESRSSVWSCSSVRRIDNAWSWIHLHWRVRFRQLQESGFRPRFSERTIELGHAML